MGRGGTTATSRASIWGGGTVDGALRLRAADVIRALKRQHGPLWERWEGSGEATLAPLAVSATREGVPDDEVNVTVALHGPRAAVALPTGQAVPMAMGRTGTGGLRWWWVCPRAGVRAAALYLPDNAGEFLSRQGHGLRHASLSESPAERAARRARKLRAALGDFHAALGDRLPDPPPRMRPATYERLCAEIREAEERALAVPRWPPGIS